MGNSLIRAASYLGFSFAVENLVMESERRRSIVMLEDSSDSSLSNEMDSLEAGYFSKSGIAKASLLQTMGILKEDKMKNDRSQSFDNINDDDNSVSSSSDSSDETTSTKRKSIVSSIAEYFSIGNENSTNKKRSSVNSRDNSYTNENKDISSQSNSISEADKVSELVSVAKKKANLSVITDDNYPALSKGLLGDSGLLSVDTCEIESIPDSNIPSSRKSSKDSIIGGNGNHDGNQSQQQTNIISDTSLSAHRHQRSGTELSNANSIDNRPFPRMGRRASII